MAPFEPSSRSLRICEASAASCALPEYTSTRRPRIVVTRSAREVLSGPRSVWTMPTGANSVANQWRR